jgi:hypothetical protein
MYSRVLFTAKEPKSPAFYDKSSPKPLGHSLRDASSCLSQQQPAELHIGRAQKLSIGVLGHVLGLLVVV